MANASPARGDDRPRIGVGVIVVRAGRVLLGERIGAHGAGTWALPGGHLEFGETVEDCARRELLEETGLQAGAISAGPFSNDVFVAERKHYLTLFMLALDATGNPSRCEPDKCLRWQWFDWQALPSPLFQPLATLHSSGYDPTR